MPRDYFPPLPGQDRPGAFFRKAPPSKFDLDFLKRWMQYNIDTFHRTITFRGSGIFNGDVISGNWDGTNPPAVGTPSDATEGFYLDSESGIIQATEAFIDSVTWVDADDGTRTGDMGSVNTTTGDFDGVGLFLTEANDEFRVYFNGSESVRVTSSGLYGLPFQYSEYESANRTFTNTSYLDLDALTGGSGTLAARSVTVETGTTALVIITAATVRNSTAGLQCFLSYRVSGDTTIAADDRQSLRHSIGGNTNVSGTFIATEDGLTPGSNTFELQARVTANTGWLDAPRITVIPL